MDKLITFDHFNTGGRRYHIYMLSESAVAQDMHYHNYFQLLYVLRGQIGHDSHSDGIILGRGDAFMIPPGFAHKLSFINPNTQVYSLAFSADLFHSGFSQSNIYKFLTGLQSHSSGGEQIHLRIELNEDQRTILRSLLDCLIKEQEICAMDEYSAAPSLIASSLYILAQNYYTEPVHSVQPSPGRYKINISGCVDYINKHYREEISAEELARMFSISKSTLYELFSQYTGLPLKQYIRNKRILDAELLIRTRPGMTLSEIASEVGYSEPSTFYRNFMELVGVSPSRYKRTYDK